jgi:hypothetical protein
VTVRRRLIQRALLALFGVAILLLLGATIVGALLGNVGWIALNRYLASPTPEASTLRYAERLFSFASAVDADHPSARLGSGMAQALAGDVNAAVESWRDIAGGYQTLIDYGLDARRQGQMDLALTLFRAADRLDTSGRDEGAFFAGTICQRTLADSLQLSLPNSSYCTAYWLRQADDLIVNGSFTTGSLAGWAGEHFFIAPNMALLGVEPDAAGDYLLRIEGLDAGYHNGLFQRLSLPPGTEIHLSGRFRLSGNEGLTARFLYLGWRDEDGNGQGNHAAQHAGSMDWATFERRFTVPDHGPDGISVYPVLFSGEGTVWFDDIRLTIAEDSAPIP